MRDIRKVTEMLLETRALSFQSDSGTSPESLWYARACRPQAQEQLRVPVPAGMITFIPSRMRLHGAGRAGACSLEVSGVQHGFCM